jgi:hypothetical protein
MAKPENSLIDALTVAYLAAQGKRQIEIGAILGLNQSAVSRLFKQVKDVYIQQSFREGLLDPATMDEIRRRASPRELANKLRAFAEKHGRRGPVVYVVPIPENADRSRQFEIFATGAAVIVKQLLADVKRRVGVAWGSTLWHVCQELRNLPPRGPWRDTDPLEFIPLCGDPLVDSPEKYKDRTSSRIVSDLSDTVNGGKAKPPAWLGLVPAFIPRIFAKKEEIEVIDEYINLVPSYRAIFGARESTPAKTTRTPKAPTIADELDMILTSAGTEDRPRGFGANPLLFLEEADSKLLAENIHGDIGGVFLPKASPADKKNTKASRLLQELTDGWTGLKRSHLEKCAARAFPEFDSTSQRGRTMYPGVTLLSFGAEHLNIVREAVRVGLINQLIIGSDIEAALLKAL